MIDRSHLRNNFDIARFFLAFTVFSGHLGIIGFQQSYFFPILKYCDGLFAVKCFFVISGFLVYRSYRLSRTAASYFEKRARRIYPAYFVMIIASVLLGLCITESGLHAFLSWKVVKYLIANLTFMNFAGGLYLPGVFTHNRFQEVNGPLWTLKLEVMFYLLVPLLFLACRRFKALWVFLAIYLASVVFRMICDRLLADGHQAFDQIGRQLPGQMSFFMAGILLEEYFEFFKRHQYWFLAAGLVGTLIYYRFGFYPTYPLSLGILVIYFCTLFFYLGAFGKYGDFSYGLYIIHYPVIQTIAATGFLADSPNLRVLFAAVTVVGLAVLMWHLVEKHFLKPRSQPATHAPEPLGEPLLVQGRLAEDKVGGGIHANESPRV